MKEEVAAPAKKPVMNLPVATHAAQALNKKYGILSRAETKEFEWRNAILLDRMNSQLPGGSPPYLPMFDALVNASVLEQEKNGCAGCRAFVTQQMEAAKTAFPEPFMPEKLIAYDLNVLPGLYLGNNLIARCASNREAVDQAASYLQVVEQYLLEKKVNPGQIEVLRSKAVAPENVNCEDPAIKEMISFSAYRIYRLADNIAFARERQANTTPPKP